MGARGPARRRTLTALHTQPGYKTPDPPLPALYGPPDMPDDLEPEAQAEWQRVLPPLERMGHLAKIDRAVLVDYCLCWARLVEAEREIRDRGLLIKGARGVVKNPACQLARDYRSALVTLRRELGLSPLARESLTDRYVDDPDDLLDFS